MLRISSLWLVLLATAFTTARAEDAPPLTTLLGASAWSRPAYTGADTNRTVPIPAIRHYGKPWFVRTTFGMLEGGARTEVLSGLTLGAQLAYEDARDSAESDFLAAHNLPTLNPGISWGVHAELEKNLGPMPLIALLRYRQDMDNNRGAQADLRFTAGIFGSYGINAGIFYQTTWANRKAANYFYGITPQQTASTGLNAFDAQEGELFNAYGLLWSYDLNPQWILLGSFETHQVRDAVSNSPLVQQNSNSYTSLGLAYQF